MQSWPPSVLVVLRRRHGLASERIMSAAVQYDSAAALSVAQDVRNPTVHQLLPKKASPQQVTVLSGRSPHECRSPADTAANEPDGASACPCSL